MKSAMARFAKSNEFKQKFMPDVHIGQVVNLFRLAQSATFARALRRPLEPFLQRDRARCLRRRCEREAPDLQEADPLMRTPKALDAIADVVLAYRPKPKTKPARKRQRARRKRDAKTARD